MAHMIEENDSMFSFRKTPWHGLGTIVEEAPDSGDALKIACLDWTIEQRPLFTQSTVDVGKSWYPKVETKYHEVPEVFANVRSDSDEVLGIVSKQYRVVQNSEAFSFTDALIGENVKYETAGSLNNGRRIWLLAKMPEQSLLGDAFVPYLLFSNSHDGSSSVRVTMTPIRVVCNNTLSLALGKAKRIWSTPHKGDMESKLEEARMTLQNAETYMKELNTEVERLARKPISHGEIKDLLDELFPIPTDELGKRKANNLVYLRGHFDNAMRRADIEKFRGTAFGIVNAASDFIGHTQPLRKTSRAGEKLLESFIDGNKFLDEVHRMVS